MQCDAEKTKDDLKAQMHGHEETLEELKKTMHEMHAMLFQMHGMAHLSDEEENNVWLMSVLGEVVDMVTACGSITMQTGTGTSIYTSWPSLHWMRSDVLAL
jgi:hypothetical protein